MSDLNRDFTQPVDDSTISTTTLVRGGMEEADPEVEQAVANELEPGERLLWCSRANPARPWLQCVPMIVAAIPFTAFALFWISAAFHDSQRFPGTGPAPGFQMFFPLFGLPFVLVGLFMLASPVWMTRSLRKTMYAVTDRRAIVVSGAWSKTVQSFAPNQFGNVSHVVRADGSGDVVFSGAYGATLGSGSVSSGMRVSRPYYSGRVQPAPGFYGVRDPRAVESLLRRLAQSPRS